MKTYKVWIEIEEYDPETDSYMTLDASHAFCAEFESEEDAQKYASQLYDESQKLSQGM